MDLKNSQLIKNEIHKNVNVSQINGSDTYQFKQIVVSEDFEVENGALGLD
jgi:hypothetical protein